jgi:hypothetical protein
MASTKRRQTATRDEYGPSRTKTTEFPNDPGLDVRKYTGNWIF